MFRALGVDDTAARRFSVSVRSHRSEFSIPSIAGGDGPCLPPQTYATDVPLTLHSIRACCAAVEAQCGDGCTGCIAALSAPFLLRSSLAQEPRQSCRGDGEMYLQHGM